MPPSLATTRSRSYEASGSEQDLAPAPAMVGVQPASKGSIIKSLVGTWGGMLISVTLYLLVGALIYTNHEGWSTVDAVYFSCVTMSTVGYGDLSPTSPTTKGLTILMILVGVISVFTQISMAFSTVTTPITRKGRELLACMCRPKKWDIDGDGEKDFESLHLPPSPSVSLHLPPSPFISLHLPMCMQVTARRTLSSRCRLLSSTPRTSSPPSC